MQKWEAIEMEKNNMRKKAIIFCLLYLLILIFSIIIFFASTMYEIENAIERDDNISASLTLPLFVMMFLPALISEIIAVRGIYTLSEHRFIRSDEKAIKFISVTASIFVIIYTLLIFFSVYSNILTKWILAGDLSYMMVCTVFAVSVVMEVVLITLRDIRCRKEKIGQNTD